MFPMPGARVQSLVRERDLICHNYYPVQPSKYFFKIKKKEKKRHEMDQPLKHPRNQVRGSTGDVFLSLTVAKANHNCSTNREGLVNTSPVQLTSTCRSLPLKRRLLCPLVRLTGNEPLLSMPWYARGSGETSRERQSAALFTSILPCGRGEGMCIFGNDWRWQCGHTGRRPRSRDTGISA